MSYSAGLCLWPIEHIPPLFRRRDCRNRYGCGGHHEDQYSGVSFGEEMYNTINLGRVTDIAYLHFKIKQLFNALHFHGKCWTIRKMIDQGVNLGKINGNGKNFFHIYVWLSIGLFCHDGATLRNVISVCSTITTFVTLTIVSFEEKARKLLFLCQ